MILHPDPPGVVAILQSAHALLAFQLADHWGNRRAPRPAPRAEVLAAALRHDAGWDGREEPLRLAADGRPLAFDTLPEDEREELWTAAVERVVPLGRYAAYLVSHHVCYLAESFSSRPHDAFLAAERARRERLAAGLALDPRWAEALEPGRDAVNRGILRATDALAVHLSRGAGGVVVVPEVPLAAGPSDVELRAVGARTYRLRPWPFAGRRLTVTTEGRRLPASHYADARALADAWSAAPVGRLSWTLLATGEPAPPGGPDD